MSQSIAKDKAFEFAKKIITLYSTMKSDHNEYIISKQLLRSWTSICANIIEGLHGESKKDFIHKMSIAYKEANETQYRLHLLQDTNIIGTIDETYFTDIKEICSILASILKTSKQRNAKNN